MGGYDIIIIGGGLAGLTAALHLTQNSYKVLVIEKEQYPNHKVCGEYVSNEVKPYLKSLGVKLDEIPYASINKLQLTTISGAGIATKLPLGGFGVSRHALDYSLYKTAINKKVTFLFLEESQEMFGWKRFLNNIFQILKLQHQMSQGKVQI